MPAANAPSTTSSPNTDATAIIAASSRNTVRTTSCPVEVLPCASARPIAGT